MNIKKIFSFVAILAVLIGAASAYAGGDGSQNNPYQVNTCSHVDDMSNNPDSYFELTADVDCGGQSLDPIRITGSGQNFNLQGNGYTLSGITYDGGNNDHVGFIGQVGGYSNAVGSAYIENITFSDMHYSRGDGFGLGVVAGTQYGNGLTLVNTTIKDSTAVASQGNEVGAVVGQNNNDNTVVKGLRVYNVSVENNGFGRVGVVAGTMYGGQLDVDGIKVIDSSSSGGSAGILTTSASGYKNSGGTDVLIAGDTTSSSNSVGGTVTNTYYDQDTTNINSGGTGKSTENLTGVGTINDLGYDLNRWSDTLNYPDLSYAVDTSPDFQITNITDDGSVDEGGDPVNITVTIQNQGLSAGEKLIEGFVDGSNRYSQLITLDSEEEKQITFQSPNYNYKSNGTHSYEATTPDDSASGSFDVNNVDLPDPNNPVIETPESGKIIYLENKSGTWGWSETSTGYINLQQDHDQGIDVSLELDDSNCNVGLNPCVGSFDLDKSYNSAGNYSFSFNYGNNFQDTDVGQMYPKSRSVDAYYTAKNAEGVTVDSSKNTFDIVVIEKPTIETFEVTPNISDADVGDKFNLTVSGDLKTFEFSNITYEMQVTNAADPSAVTVTDPDYVDKNIYNDKIKQVFEYKQEYKGEEITISATVTDQRGYSTTASKSGLTEVPPDHFLQNAPSNGDTFLLPEGTTTENISFEYGVDTAQNGGAVELVVDGTVEDTFSAGSDTTEIRKPTLDLGEGSYDWYVRFTDSATGVEYTSSTYSFDVTDEPINLNLQSPSDTQSIIEGSALDVDHNFEIDARALPDNYYYEFNLTNDDTGTVEADVTSSSYDTGVATYTETVTGLDAGNYTWNVDVYRSSDDVHLESKSETYEIVEDQLFESEILLPSDGQSYDLEGDSRNINASYRVKTYKQNVDTEIYLDGELAHLGSISKNSEEAVDIQLQNVSSGDHELRLYVEDSQGRNRSKNVTFSVEEGVPEITTMEFSPSLENASVGDEIDVYVEGKGNPEDVDFVEVEITDASGNVIETYIIPSEDLKEGSWYTTIQDAFTVTQDLLNQEITVKSIMTDAVGRVSEYYQTEILGENRDVAASIQLPVEDQKIPQVDGEPEPITVIASATAAFNKAYYDLTINGTYIESGSITQDSQKTIEVYPEISQFSGSQFGTYNVKLYVEDSQQSDIWTSTSNTFKVIKDTGDPVLNFNSPEPNEPFYYSTGRDTASVPFQFDIDTPESGELTLKVDGTQLDIDGEPVKQVENGFTQASTSHQFEEGTYKALLEFESESYSINETRTFSVDKKEPPEKDKVVLRNPSNGEDLYKDFGVSRANDAGIFSWSTYGSSEGNSTLYIENAAGSVVESYSRDYNDVNERRTYSDMYKVDLNVGDYTFYAEFDQENDSTTYTSEEREFTVVDFEPPRTTLVDPINETFVSNESILFEWRTETFREEAQVDLMIRKIGEYKADSEYTSGQNSNEIKDYDTNVSLDRGKYEYFIKMQVDGATFESDTARFTVEPADVKDPVFNLKDPEQGTTYEISSGNTTQVTFNYSAEVFTESSSEVKLLLQTVESSSEDPEYKEVNTELQSLADGKVAYTVPKELEESGYRYKLQAEYPSGNTVESKVKSFAVNNPETEETPEVPDAEPQKSLIDHAADFMQKKNAELKSALGSTGQYFLATIILVLAAGVVHLWAKIDIVTISVMILGILGFSLADGYYPLEIFWIFLALAAGIAAWLGAKGLSGGGS